MTGQFNALRGRAIDFSGNPFELPTASCFTYYDDALVIMTGETIHAVGPYHELIGTLPEGTHVEDYKDAILTAGFIDTHVHYPQLEMIGAYGEQLLAWLEKYTFPTEQKFQDRAYANAAAKLFLQELFRSGTTTAAVYCTVHPQSVDAFFAESAKYNSCMIAGKVMMDRNAPEALRDTAQSGYDASATLIQRWHKTADSFIA